MPDVFISYSRRNLDFVTQMAEKLAARGKDPWFDQVKEPLQGIPPGSKWWEEIKYGIESVDNFLFVISPDSIASPYCNAEIAHALTHDKRIVTVLYTGDTGEAATLQAIDQAIEMIDANVELPKSVSADVTNLRSLTRRNWLALSQIQYVPFETEIELERSMDQLVKALDLDLAWIRMRSQLRQAAQLWKDNDFHDAYLWPEERLRPLRDMMGRVQAELSDLEREFSRSEVDRLLEEIEAVDTTHLRRSQIGERLSVIGDPRPGVGLRSDGLPDIVWCSVGGGEIEIEGQKFEINPFYIAKYHITYVQFQVFLEADDGFDLDRWWVGLDARYRKQPMVEQLNRYPSYPRDSISWYQAVAYSQWLAEKLPLAARPQRGKGTADWIIRLPTEWEWQQAATGGNPDNLYPWGDRWDNRLASTTEAGIGRSTSVGMYPDGKAPVGAMDMAGNVRDWCLNEFESFRTALGGDRPRSLRGSSFDFDPSRAQTTARDSFGPHWQGYVYGFRVVCVPPDA